LPLSRDFERCFGHAGRQRNGKRRAFARFADHGIFCSLISIISFCAGRPAVGKRAAGEPSPGRNMVGGDIGYHDQMKNRECIGGTFVAFRRRQKSHFRTRFRRDGWECLNCGLSNSHPQKRSGRCHWVRPSQLGKDCLRNRHTDRTACLREHGANLRPAQRITVPAGNVAHDVVTDEV
jgi:hypothetical protein